MSTSSRRKPVPPWCGMCSEHGRLVDLEDGTAARCARCHPATQPGGRHAPRVHGTGARHLDAMLGGDR